MQIGQLFSVASVDGTHFTEPLAVGFGEVEHLELPAAVSAGTGRSRCRVMHAILWSTLANSWEFLLFSQADGPSPDPNVDRFLGRFEFSATQMQQLDGAGLYRAFIQGLDIPYEDDGLRGELHCYLVNRGPDAHLGYGAGHHLRISLWCEPTQGF